MSARGVSGGDEAGDVEVVLLGIFDYPTQRATAIFDRSRRDGNLRQPVLDVYDRPAHVEVGEDAQYRSFLGAARPSTAMDVDDRWRRPGGIFRLVAIKP